MNTKSLSHHLRLALACSSAALATALFAGEEGTTATVKLSDPAKPATLKVALAWAEIYIVGTDTDTVTVESSLDEKGTDTRGDGLRRLDDQVSFELTESGNVVTLSVAGENPWMGGQNGEFHVKVPRQMALDIKTEIGGDLEVKDVTGDIEINSMNGEVKLEGLVGSTVVNTMNGEVHAVYARIPQKVVSITSMNGEIDLRVPAETKANVRLRTHNGSILTDFDDKRLKTKSEGRSYGGSEAARMGAEAARAAAEGARVAVEVAQEFAREMKVQVERAVSEHSEAQVASPASPAAPATPSPRAPRPPRPPMPPITGGKLVSGTLNGGGDADIKISTMNGEITLRQTDGTGSSSNQSSDRVTVDFENPDKFTDASDERSTMTSQDVLDELAAYVKEIATPLVGAGNRLEITFLDLDLAGTVRPDKDNIRVMTATTIPRATVRFKFIGANGAVVAKEGERKLSDLNYQQNARMFSRNEPLVHDKQLLKDWLTKEFKSGT